MFWIRITLPFIVRTLFYLYALQVGFIMYIRGPNPYRPDYLLNFD